MLRKIKNTNKFLDPRQEAFLLAYLDPKSPTFANAKKTGLKVGYGKKYSENLFSEMPEWLDEMLKDASLIKKATQNLSNTLSDKENKNLQWDATKFTLTRLHKDKWSERQELSGAGGQSLIPDEMKILYDKKISNFLSKKNDRQNTTKK